MFDVKALLVQTAANVHSQNDVMPRTERLGQDDTDSHLKITDLSLKMRLQSHCAVTVDMVSLPFISLRGKTTGLHDFTADFFFFIN